MATDIFDREHRFALEDLYSGEGKSRVESEVILPDYKEAAQRILRVDCKSRVNSKNIYPGSNQLICEVEGVCNLYLLYFSELKGDHGIPCSFSVQEPFSYTFKIPTKGESRSPEELAAILEIRTENLSHMLLGPRKIAIRSDLSLTLNIKHNAPFDYYSDTFPKDICTKTVPISAARLLETYSEEMNFSETISLPKASLAIGEISEMEVELFAHRIIPTEGGIRLQGSCDVHCNYTAQDEESFVSFYQPIDFERNLGIASCSQSSFCEVFLTPNFMKATTDINEEGENKNILFEIGCTAEVFVFENQRFDVATDLFSTESFLETERAEISLEEIALKNEFCIPYKNSVSFREKGIVRAEAIRCRADFQNAYQEGEGISI